MSDLPSPTSQPALDLPPLGAPTAHPSAVDLVIADLSQDVLLLEKKVERLACGQGAALAEAKQWKEMLSVALEQLARKTVSLRLAREHITDLKGQQSEQ